MESENSIDIASLDDEECYSIKIESDLSNISNFAIFNQLELFSEPFNHFCHYLSFQKQLQNTID